MSNHLPNCQNCNKQVTEEEFIEFYDAYFCLDCQNWAEAPCDEMSCIFCAGRPNNPLETMELVNGILIPKEI